MMSQHVKASVCIAIGVPFITCSEEDLQSLTKMVKEQLTVQYDAAVDCASEKYELPYYDSDDFEAERGICFTFSLDVPYGHQLPAKEWEKILTEVCENSVCKELSLEQGEIASNVEELYVNDMAPPNKPHLEHHSEKAQERKGKNMSLKWKPVLESRNEETGEDCCFSAMVFPDKNGADRFLWIEKADDGNWNVMSHSNDAFHRLMTCKTLASAKHWVSMQYSAEIAGLSKREDIER